MDDKEGGDEAAVIGDCDIHSFRFALIEFYKKYNPEKVSTIDNILDKYNGNETELMNNLKDKYNVVAYKLFDDFITRQRTPVTHSAPNTPHSLQATADRRVSPVPSSSTPNSNRSLTSSGASSKQSAAPPSLMSLGSMQDLSSRFLNITNNWGINNPAATNSDSSSGAATAGDESPWTSRSGDGQGESYLSAAPLEQRPNLDAELRSLAAQLATVKRDNAALRNDNVELKTRQAALQRSLLDGGGAASMPNTPLVRESLSGSDVDRARHVLTERLRTAEAQKLNKHHQLLESIELNHALEAQLRYLAVRAYSTCDSATDSVSSATDQDVVSLAANVNSHRAIGILTDPSFITALAALPDVREVCALTSTADGAAIPLEQRSSAELASEVAHLRRHTVVLQTALLASRVEHRLEARQRAVTEERIAQQQLEVGRLRRTLSSTDTQLEAASGSADGLKQQVTDAMAQVAHYKTMVARADQDGLARSEELTALREAVDQLGEKLATCEQARCDLSVNCAARLLDSEQRSNEYVRRMREAVLLEREDILARLAATAALSADLRVAVSGEAQREVQRLRDELLRARRSDAQKEREVAFLQKQLQEAARRIAQDARDRELQQAKRHPLQDFEV